MEVTSTGIRTESASYPLDVIVLATGFQADAYVRPMKVVGMDGMSLDELWADGPFAHRGLALPFMPGFFIMVGPHSPIGNISIMYIAEQQAGYIIRCIERMLSRGEFWAPMPEATNAFLDDMRDGLKSTRWVTGCNSWYRNETGGIAIYPFTAARFEQEMSSGPDEREFYKLISKAGPRISGRNASHVR